MIKKSLLLKYLFLAAVVLGGAPVWGMGTDSEDDTAKSAIASRPPSKQEVGCDGLTISGTWATTLKEKQELKDSLTTIIDSKYPDFPEVSIEDISLNISKNFRNNKSNSFIGDVAEALPEETKGLVVYTERDFFKEIDPKGEGLGALGKKNLESLRISSCFHAHVLSQVFEEHFKIVDPENLGAVVLYKEISRKKLLNTREEQILKEYKMFFSKKVEDEEDKRRILSLFGLDHVHLDHVQDSHKFIWQLYNAYKYFSPEGTLTKLHAEILYESFFGLKKLELSRVKIPEKSLQALGKKLVSLEKMALCWAELTDKGVKELRKGADAGKKSQTKTLISLNLSQNPEVTRDSFSDLAIIIQDYMKPRSGSRVALYDAGYKDDDLDLFEPLEKEVEVEVKLLPSPKRPVVVPEENQEFCTIL